MHSWQATAYAGYVVGKRGFDGYKSASGLK